MPSDSLAIGVDRGDHVVYMVAAELRTVRVCENQRHHRLADDPGGGDGAGVGALA